ncbi:MAG TPA: arylsulfatase [Clostridia bacterium]|nr:arylsulfatase [Clostridia bacterium]
MVSGKPNIVFVLTDDQGYGDLGCHGNPVIKTPGIDGFYEDCVRFTNYHVGPTCAPTRAGLMTGHYANSTGVWHTFSGRSLLRENEWTIADALSESGYMTGIFGKWHLGDTYPYRPMDRGFKTSVIHGGGGISQIPDYWGNDYFDDVYRVNDEPVKFNGYCTDVFFSEGIRFIEENKDNQFFCCITLNAPHTPLNVPPEYPMMYKGLTDDKKARFYGMITNIDENFARLRGKLLELGLEENTILIFMTDNGSDSGIETDMNQFVTSGFNAGMRGKKNSEYDGGHRVPFFVRWPEAGIAGGRDIHNLAANVDFMPTLLELCGIEKRADIKFHGKSLCSILVGDGDWPERVVVTDSQRHPIPKKWHKSAVMTDRWRLVNGSELYDMDCDREQRTDVAGQYPDTVEILRNEYEKWWEAVSVQFDRMIPIHIGKMRVPILAQDMRNEECVTAWGQHQVRRGLKALGYWEIHVDEAGEYEFDMRRWPDTHERPVDAGIHGEDIEFSKRGVWENDWFRYSGGKAIPITRASIEIQGIHLEASVPAGSEKAVFNIKLDEGICILKASFGTEVERELLSPYFIYSTRI